MNVIIDRINACNLCEHFYTAPTEIPCVECRKKTYPKEPARKLKIRGAVYVLKEGENNG